MKLVLALLLLVSAIVQAEPKLGVAYYALARFSSTQCDVALSVFDGVAEPSLSILWGTFGKSTVCLKRFLVKTKDRPALLLIHAWNDTCRVMGRTCTALDLENRNIRAQELGRFLRTIQATNLTVIVSTGLEDVSSDAVYFARVKALKTYLPKWALIERNPHGKAWQFGGASFIESHALQRSIWGLPAIYSNDGWDINFRLKRGQYRGKTSLPFLLSAVRRNEGGYRYVFLWWRESQGGEQFSVKPDRRRVVVRREDVSKLNRELIK